jgi:hypothetical protein
MDKKIRKELVRAAREAAKPMGVFSGSSVASGDGVVGTSRDLPSMLNRHRAQLQLGAHPDKTLQHEWDARGADAIAFEVLDTLEPKDDPGYDPAADLEAQGELWRERLAEQ